nr:MetQ/NlpA family ABC transporter substrate-binding protein [Pseudogemmobacter hezensis]
MILVDAGLITLKEGGEPLTVIGRDIAENPRNLTVVALDDARLIPALDDVDASFLYSSQAIEVGPGGRRDAPVPESETFRSPDVVCVKAGTGASVKIPALKKANQSKGPAGAA